MNHPGATDSLTGAIRQHEEMWRTPDAPHGGGVRNRQASRGQGHQLTIAEQAEHWPTPAARDYRSPNSEESQDRRSEGREAAGQQLPNFVAHLWATPISFLPDPLMSLRGDASSPSDQTSRPLWPTPITADCGHGRGAPLDYIGGNLSLTGAVNQNKETWSEPRAQAESPPPKAKLNPRFVEWLMGLSPGWTSVTASTDSERAEMVSFHYRLRQRLSSWLAEQD